MRCQPRAPRYDIHAEHLGNLCDVTTDIAHAHDAQCFAAQHARHWRWPFTAFDGAVDPWDFSHQRHHQAKGEFTRAGAETPSGLGNHDTQPLRRFQIDVISMIACMGDDAQFRDLFHELGGEQGALTIGDDRVKTLQVFRALKRPGEDFDLGVFTQSADA
ncbi:hypothetical protein D3C87_1652030 [compost metagenome]